MNKQAKIITYLLALLMLLQPIMVTVSYASAMPGTGNETENETENETVQDTDLLVITINDSALYEALKAHKDVMDYADRFEDEDNQIEITRGALKSITSLNFKSCNISDLSGIENFTELTELYLPSNKLTKNSNLDKLNALTKLKILDLSNNQIEDISSISGLINKNIQLNLDQNIRIVDYVSKVEAPDTYEEAEDMFLNNEKQSVDLPQILYACGNTSVYVSSLEVDGIPVDPYVYTDHIEIKDNKIIFQETKSNKYEIWLKLDDNLPNNSTECFIKVYRIDTDKQVAIAFKDRNLYKAIETKYNGAFDTKISDNEWRYSSSNNKSVSSSLAKDDKWTFDPDDLIIIANREDISKITGANLSQKGIADLTGIEHFTGLTTLNLSDNEIINIEPLRKLNENKKVNTSQLDGYIEKLKTFTAEYNEIENKISELETKKSDIKNGKEVEGYDTTDEIQEDIDDLEADQKTKIAVMRRILVKINSLDGKETAISKLLSGYSTLEEIKAIIDKYQKLELNQTQITQITNNLSNLEQGEYALNQKNAIETYRLKDIADRISKIITTNLTVGETEALKGKEIVYIIDDTDTIVNEDTTIKIETSSDEDGSIYTTEQKEKAMAITAIEKLKKDVADDNLDEILFKIGEINKYVKNDIVDKKDGDYKDIATLISEFIAKLTTYNNSESKEFEKDIKIDSNGTTSRENNLIALYIRIYDEDVTSDTSDVNLAGTGKKGQDTYENLEALAHTKLTSTINSNITKYENKSTNAITSLIQKITTKSLLTGSVDYKGFITESNELIKAIIEEYTSYQELLDALKTGLAGINYSTVEEESLLSIIERLNALSPEEKQYIERLSELKELNLSINSISDTSGLADLNTLEILNVSDNLLSEFDFSKFQNIKELYISKTLIRDVEIEELRNVEKLDLSDNKIKNIDKINLAGMPELKSLNLNKNEITDLGSLLYSRNKTILLKGYKTLADYLSAGEAGFNIAGQIIEFDLLNIYTDEEYMTYDLPVIFFQLEDLRKTDKFDVEYSWDKPCTKAYWSNEGAKYVLDTTLRDVFRQAKIYMSVTANNSVDTCTYIVNYMVTTDSTKPMGGNIVVSPESFTRDNVTVTVEGAVDIGSGLQLKAYSFDGGKTWQKSNSKTFSENTNDIVIHVRDNNKNVFVHDRISVTNIDRTAPEIEVERAILDEGSEVSSITISVKDNSEKLNQANEYKYYLSTKRDGEENPEWKTYNPGESFTIGEGLEGTYYMFVNTISDEAGNVSEPKETMEFTFKKLDKVAPTITGISGMPDSEVEESVTLTIEGANDDVALHEHAYSFDGGETWQKSASKTYFENTKDIQILVRDTSGNQYVHNEVLEITKLKNKDLVYLTFEGITKIISAYLNNDYANLSEDLLAAAGDDKKFSFSEVTGLISLYLSKI